MLLQMCHIQREKKNCFANSLCLFRLSQKGQKFAIPPSPPCQKNQKFANPPPPLSEKIINWYFFIVNLQILMQYVMCDA